MLLHAQALPDTARRPLVLLAIAALHVLLIAALANGFAQRVLSAATQRTVIHIIDEPRERPIPPQLPPLEPPTQRIALEPPPVGKVDLRLPPIDPPITDGNAGSSAIHALPPRPTGAIPPTAPIVVLGRNALPNTEDYYPAASRRRAEEGSAQVRACVDERGRLANAPQLMSSSGHPLLDEAAMEVVRAGHYARATRGGVPIGNCYGFRIAFRFR
jgi:periplasmic protein TonB